MERIVTDGIVIKEVDYMDSSKILTIITREYGVVSVISKGCKNIKSKLRSASLKLSYASFSINYKKDGLSTLTDASLKESLNNILKDMNKILYVSYILELTSEVLKENYNYEEIFDLMINCLYKINNGLNEKAITNILEIKYLNYLGIDIHTSSCVKCGNNNDISTISIIDGGYICKNCYNGGKIYNEKVIKLIHLYKIVDLNKLDKLDIKDNITNEIGEIIDIFYEEYTGIFLKSKSLLKKVVK